MRLDSHPASSWPRIPRVEYALGSRQFRLSEQETQALVDVGRFRVIRRSALARYVFSGDVGASRQALKRLASLGLVEQVLRPTDPADRLVVLTRAGRRLVEQSLRASSDQVVYAGLRQQRQIDHDAELYRVYQAALPALVAESLTPIRVALDYELKAKFLGLVSSLRSSGLYDAASAAQKAAKETGLTLEDGHVALPDVRIVCVTSAGETVVRDLELVTRWSRNQARKERSGFWVFATPDAALPESLEEQLEVTR